MVDGSGIWIKMTVMLSYVFDPWMVLTCAFPVVVVRSEERRQCIYKDDNRQLYDSGQAVGSRRDM
jgi:hypothetical protein